MAEGSISSHPSLGPTPLANPAGRDTGRRRRWFVDAALSALAVLFLSIFVIRVVLSYCESHRKVLLLLMVTESLTVVLVTIARSPRARSTNPLEVVTAMAATYYFLMFDTLGDGRALLPDPFPELVQAVGIVLQIASKWTLGRSFGLLPANRGVVSSGPYRIVRHPVYLSYLIGHVGFLLGFLSLHNLLVILSLYALQIARLLMEERFLLEDSAYAAYAKKVRWRFIPFLF